MLKKAKKISREIPVPTLERLFGYLVGTMGIVGFGFSIYQLYTYVKMVPDSNNIDLSNIFWPLSLAIFFLVLSFIFMGFFYQKTLARISSNYVRIIEYVEYFKDIDSIWRNQVLSFHNYLHYYRYILYDADLILEKKNDNQNIEDNEIIKFLDDTKTLLLNTLSELKSVFDKITRDNCSTSLLVVLPSKNGETMIKTFFRDSTLFRKRRTLDLKEYNSKNHTAFKTILDRNDDSTIFFSDNLEKERNYCDFNPNWRNYYNALAVVPISIVPDRKHPKKREVVGFLCVDNLLGGLIYAQNEEFLCALGDSLYILIDKVIKIVDFSITRGINHEIIRKFTDRSSCG